MQIDRDLQTTQKLVHLSGMQVKQIFIQKQGHARYGKDCQEAS